MARVAEEEEEAEEEEGEEEASGSVGEELQGTTQIWATPKCTENV